MGSFNSKGFPSRLQIHDTRYLYSVATENGIMHISKPKTFIGDLVDFEFIIPSSGKSICLKGMTVIGNGNVGTVYLKRSSDNSNIFASYFSAQVKGSPSSAFNLVLEPDEKVLITSIDRGTSESFVGVTYIEYDEAELIAD